MNISRYARLRLPSGEAAFARIEGGRAIVLSAAPWLGGEPTGEEHGGFDDEARGPLPRLAPVAPSKILCVGRNYGAHAREMQAELPKEPLLFLKPPSSLLDPDGTIELPPSEVATRIDHEVELAIVVGTRLRKPSAEEASAAIFGLTIAGDITARDLQKADGQWTRAKGMDTFCPVGPVVVRGLDPADLTIRCSVGDELRQDGHTGDMIFSAAQILAYASRFITLEPGDLVLTGTPSGVGPLRPGVDLHMSITSIGRLSLSVAAG